MRFLGVLGLGAIRASCIGHIARTIFAVDGGARLLQGFRSNMHAIGPHIGDQSDPLTVQRHALVKLLRHAHGLARGEGQFARGFLLQGRGGERR